MDVVDAEHKKSLYRDERIILVDTQTKALIRGKPGWWQMTMGGFLFSNRIARSVKGILYLTNRRILFIREVLKEDIEPKSTKERIQLRKDRELFQHLVGIQDIKVRTPRLGKPDLEILYKPLSVETKPFKFVWKVGETKPEVWVSKTKKLLEKAKAPSKDDLKISG